MQRPIDFQDFLFVIAQVSVALGGFASVVKALKPTGRNMEPRDFIGLRLTVEHSFAALFAALLPLAFWYSDFQRPWVWRNMSALIALFLAGELVSHVVRVKRETKRGFPPRHPWALRFHFLPGTAVVLILMITNVLHWQSAEAYVWALVWLLNPPCFQLYLFFFPPDHES